MPALKTHRALVLASVMAAMFMIAIEATIVSTAMPEDRRPAWRIATLQLGFLVVPADPDGDNRGVWKVSDLFGRKAVMLLGIGIFLVGSATVRLRLVHAFDDYRSGSSQGDGAGAILPVAMTVIGDLYSAQERGKIQGYTASVWALSAVIGPLAGGLIVQHISWAWIFWINIPDRPHRGGGFLGLSARKYRPRDGAPIDYFGAVLFTIAIAAMMADLTAMSTAGWAAIGALTAALFVASAAAFVAQERRAPEPDDRLSSLGVGVPSRPPTAPRCSAAWR